MDSYRVLKTKFRIVLTIMIIMALGFGTGLGLYLNQRTNDENLKKEAYITAAGNAVELMGECIESDFDYDMKYRRIVSELAVADQLLFMLDDDSDNYRILHTTYYAFIRLPNQAKQYMTEYRAGLIYLTQGDTEMAFKLLEETNGRLDTMDITS